MEGADARDTAYSSRGFSDSSSQHDDCVIIARRSQELG